MADYGNGVNLKTACCLEENSPAFAVYSQYPFLAPSLRDPDRLKGLLLIYRRMAANGGEAQAADFTDRAVKTEQALKDLYNIDYKAPGFTR